MTALHRVDSGGSRTFRHVLHLDSVCAVAEPRTLVEDYLKTLQAPEANGPGSFNTPWVQLTPAQQAGVIMAANAAANGECG